MAFDEAEVLLLTLFLLGLSFILSEPDFFHYITAMGFLFFIFFCKRSLGEFFATGIVDRQINMSINSTIGVVLALFFGVAFMFVPPQTFEDEIRGKETQNEPTEGPDVVFVEDLFETQEPEPEPEPEQDLQSSGNLLKPSPPSPIDIALGLTIPNLVLRDTPNTGNFSYDSGKQLATVKTVQDIKYAKAANALFTEKPKSWTSFFFPETLSFFLTTDNDTVFDVLNPDSNTIDFFKDKMQDGEKGVDVKSERENLTFFFPKKRSFFRALIDEIWESNSQLFGSPYSEGSFTYFKNVCTVKCVENGPIPCCQPKTFECNECKMFGDPFSNLDKEQLQLFFSSRGIKDQDKMKRATDLSDIERAHFAMFLFNNNYKGSFKIGGELEEGIDFNIQHNSTPFLEAPFGFFNQQDDVKVAAEMFIERYKSVFGDMTTTSTSLFVSEPKNALVISPAGEKKTFRFSDEGGEKAFRFFLYKKTRKDNKKRFVVALEAFIFDVASK
jgi:hypothetical protein